MATAVFLVTCGLLVFRPDEGRPLPFADFADFVALLDGESSIGSRFLALVKHYAAEGRASVVTLALLAVKWSAFGWWGTGWFIARALMMIAIFALGYVLGRRLGFSRLGAVVGSSVFLFAPPAVDAWLYLTTAEPLGTALVLLLSIMATRFQTTIFWKWHVVVHMCGVVTLLLTKELLGPLLLLPLILALVVQDGTILRPRRNARNDALIAGYGLAVLVAVTPIIAVYLSADTSGYAAYYGREFQSPFLLIALWVTTLVPFPLFVHSPHWSWALAVFAMIALLGAGWHYALRDGNDRARARVLLWLALGLPFAGMLAYVPLPWYATFYSLPYLTGSALLLGVAVTQVERKARRGPLVAIAAASCVLLFSIGSAFDFAGSSKAMSRRDTRLARYAADSLPVDSIYFVARRPARAEWREQAEKAGLARGYAATLNRFAAASGARWAPFREVSCAEARSIAAERSTTAAIVATDGQCPGSFTVSATIVERFTRLSWSSMRLTTDSVVVGIARIH